MPVIKEYPRDSSYGICFRGLKEDCDNQEVNDATVLASVTDGDKNVLTGPITIPPTGTNGDYVGVIPAFTIPDSIGDVYVNITISKTTSFQTSIWEPHIVVDRRMDS